RITQDSRPSVVCCAARPGFVGCEHQALITCSATACVSFASTSQHRGTMRTQSTRVKEDCLAIDTENADSPCCPKSGHACPAFGRHRTGRCCMCCQSSAAGALNKPLAIDADTLACEWDGGPVDHGAVIEHLAAADGLEARSIACIPHVPSTSHG